MNSLSKPISASKFLYALTALWLLMQLWLFSKFGVQVVFDSHRYIADANRLLAGGDFRLSYISYTLILAAFLKLTGAATGVVWLQMIFSLATLFAFFKLAHRLFDNTTIAFGAGLLLIIWPDYQQWNLYVHTESLYVSAIILVFSRLITAQKGWHYSQLALLLIFLMFLRSNGFMVSLAVISYIASDFWLKRGYRLRWLVAALFFGGIPVLVFLAHFFLSNSSGFYSFTGHLISESVIQGYNSVRVERRGEVALVGSPLHQIIQVVCSEPAFFFKRSLQRLLFYWGQVRPYYSTPHIWAICLFFYTQYLLGMYGILKGQLQTPLLTAIVIFGALNTAMVLVSGVDWDNRFMMPMLPFVYLTATAGLYRLGRKYDML